ncbi:putative PB1 domain-containing protein [Helianthus anomalus]
MVKEFSLIEAVSSTKVESIDRTFRNFKSGKEPVLLQSWESMPSNSEDMGCNLMLTDQTFMSAPDEGLEEYKRRCLESRCRFVGLETSVYVAPLADITDLHIEVKKRFPELEHQTFRVEYDDVGGNRLLISSGEDLRACIAESSLKGGQFIKIFVLLHT